MWNRSAVSGLDSRLSAPLVQKAPRPMCTHTVLAYRRLHGCAAVLGRCVLQDLAASLSFFLGEALGSPLFL